MTDQAKPVPPAQEMTGFSKGWTLVLLTLLFGFNQLDRGIVAILIESLKAEMHLSDTAIGLMTGLGFSLVYAACSLPIGRYADRGNRVMLVGIGAFFYSIMAATMGFAQNVTQLLLARGAVAVGEATGSAPSSTIISDMYGPTSRTRAIAIWSAGSYLGLFAGLVLGGWLNAHYGWRVALWATAAPGAVVALLLLFTVKDPVRGGAEGKIDREVQPLGKTIATLAASPSYRWLFLALTFAAVTNYAFQVWVPSLLQRVHHLGPADVGFYAGLFKGLFGLAGILTGGFITNMVAKGRVKLLPVIPIIVAGLAGPALLTFLLADNKTMSLIALGAASFLMPAYQAASMTMLHAVARPRMRSMAVTVAFAGVALAGLGLGPLIVGILSDLFQPHFGASALRYALIVPALIPIITALCFSMVRRTIAQDHARMLEA